MRLGRGATALAVVGLPIVALLGTLSGDRALAGGPAGDLSVPTRCVPYRLVGLDAVTADGEVVPMDLPESVEAAHAAAALDHTLGRQYHFELDGTSVVVSVPPAGWTPAKAPNDQLRRYHIPSRPDRQHQAALRAWTNQYSRMTVQAGTPCSDVNSAVGPSH